jgi:very-short-patch-repair endonuclease
LFDTGRGGPALRSGSDEWDEGGGAECAVGIGVDRWRASCSTARELRTNQAHAEKLLWSKLRRRNMDHAKFRRQHPLYGFMVDCCCIAQRRVIEVDGDSQAERAAYDTWRTERLGKHGFRVLRFVNDELRTNLDGAMEAIWQAVQSPSPSQAPPPVSSPMSKNGGGKNGEGTRANPTSMPGCEFCDRN